MRASSQGTSSPSIQIFSVFSKGMGSDPPRDRIADLGGRSLDVVGLVDRGAYSGPGVVLAEELQHHRGRDDGRARIGLAGAGDVGRRAVDGLEQRRAGAGGVEVAG